MALSYSAETAGLALNPVVKGAATLATGGRQRRFRGVITLAAQATTDQLIITILPAGHLFAGGYLWSTVSLGTSTLAIGGGVLSQGVVSGLTAAKYRAASTFTAVDTGTVFGNTAAVASQTPSASDEAIVGTLAAAALPGSGTLVVDMFASNG